ncbi:MAG TPA: hypothetical protein VI033_03845 [Candidatus Nitrosopolaris sp.]|jgi:hypothetical protein
MMYLVAIVLIILIIINSFVYLLTILIESASAQINRTTNVNNSAKLNAVTTGDNIVPFSTLATLSHTSPRPIRAECLIYGYVADDKPLGNLLIIKFKEDGSCNPTIELFTNIGRVLGVLPSSSESTTKSAYSALFFIRYVEKPTQNNAQNKGAFVS